MIKSEPNPSIIFLDMQKNDLSPFIMHSLHADAQINIEIVNFLWTYTHSMVYKQHRENQLVMFQNSYPDIITSVAYFVSYFQAAFYTVFQLT